MTVLYFVYYVIVIPADCFVFSTQMCFLSIFGLVFCVYSTHGLFMSSCVVVLSYLFCSAPADVVMFCDVGSVV